MSSETEDDDKPLDDRSARNLVVALAVVVEGGLIGVAWLLGWALDIPSIERLRFDWAGLGWGLLATLPMLVGFFLAARWPVGPLKSIKRFTDETIRPMMWPLSLLDLAGISLLAGLGEELFFRAVVQEAFRGVMAPWLAVLFAAVLFGLLHAVTPSYAVLATGMGVYLGFVFYRTDSLLAVVVAHAVYDFVALIWVTRGPGSDAHLPEPEEEQGQEE